VPVVGRGSPGEPCGLNYTERCNDDDGPPGRVASSAIKHEVAGVTLGRDVIDAIGRRTARALEADLRHWSHRWSLPSLSRDVSICINSRLRTSIARFRRDRNCIEVGPGFLSGGRIRREVLAHEFAHAAVAALYGRTARIHGEEWRSLMRAIGISPRHRITSHAGQLRSRIASSNARYEHRCPVCQMTRISTRRVPGWRCRECVEAGLTGKLEVRRLDHG
jgi:predicted SprT family Zn-dependent metalloprotease